MRKIALTFALASIALGMLVRPWDLPAARANQSAQQAYCVPPNVFNPGDQGNSRPFMANWQHAEVCSGNLGLFWSDGAIYNPTFTFSGSSLAFTFPMNNWVAQGQGLFTAAFASTALANATTYWWLDTGAQCTSGCDTAPAPSASPGTSLWTFNETGSPPDATSVLEYTITTNSIGITSVLYGPAQSASPAYANFQTNGTVTAADLTASNQAGHAGDCAVYDNTGKTYASPCPTGGGGGGGGVSQIIAGSNITVSPTGGTGNVTVAETITPAPPSPGPGIIIATPYPNKISVDQTYSFTWTGQHIFDPSANVPAVGVYPAATASASPCPGPTAASATPPQGAFCIGPNGSGTASSTNQGGLVLGKSLSTAQWGDTNTSNSQPLTFVRNNGAGDYAASEFLGSGGTWTIGAGLGASAIVLKQNTTVGGTLEAEASGNLAPSYVAPVFTASGSAINSNLHASLFTCTFSSGTTCTTSAWLGAAVFTSGADILGCNVLDTSTSAPSARFVAYNPTSTTVSFSASASNSDTITGVCWGY